MSNIKSDEVKQQPQTKKKGATKKRKHVTFEDVEVIKAENRAEKKAAKKAVEKKKADPLPQMPAYVTYRSMGVQMEWNSIFLAPSGSTPAEKQAEWDRYFALYGHEMEPMPLGMDKKDQAAWVKIHEDPSLSVYQKYDQWRRYTPAVVEAEPVPEFSGIDLTAASAAAAAAAAAAAPSSSQAPPPRKRKAVVLSDDDESDNKTDADVAAAPAVADAAPAVAFIPPLKQDAPLPPPPPTSLNAVCPAPVFANAAAPAPAPVQTERWGRMKRREALGKKLPENLADISDSDLMKEPTDLSDGEQKRRHDLSKHVTHPDKWADVPLDSLLKDKEPANAVASAAAAAAAVAAPVAVGVSVDTPVVAVASASDSSSSSSSSSAAAGPMPRALPIMPPSIVDLIRISKELCDGIRQLGLRMSAEQHQ
jgi:hypothetical protein